MKGEDTGPPPDPSTDSLGYLKGKAASAQKAGRPKKKTDVETFTDRGGRTFKYVIFKTYGSPETSGVAAEVKRGSNTFNFDVRSDGRVLVTQ